MTVHLEIPGPPQGKARPRMTKRGHVYTPQATRDYEDAIAGIALKAMKGRMPIDGPVYLSLTAYYPVPASWSERKKLRAIAGDESPTVKPDLDNVLKAVADALNGIVYLDDKQIVASELFKKYSSLPAVHVFVTPWEHDSTSPDPTNEAYRRKLLAEVAA